MLFQDIRDEQIIFLSLFLVLGIATRDWTLRPELIGVAIASKFVFSFGEKHFFNPANFGIIFALLLTNNAWVSPGQWGEDWLETWLNRNGYKIPRGAKQLLKPYIRSSMKFFVAKVNLAKFAETGYQFLCPLQIYYQSPKYMLPIRLGIVQYTARSRKLPRTIWRQF